MDATVVYGGRHGKTVMRARMWRVVDDDDAFSYLSFQGLELK
jgi:hypothetical protein